MEIKPTITLIFYRLRYKLQEWKVIFSKKMEELNKKGRERLTVMVIPHTEDKSINFHISYRTISAVIGSMILLMFISAINVLSHSGSIHELTELNLTNKDFIRQSAKMKSEVQDLHQIVGYYYKKISNLYIKLGGDPAKVSQGIGGGEEDSKTALPPGSDIPADTFKLKENIHNLKISSELTGEIIQMIKKRKSIIKHTPSLWPTKGYVLFPYGEYLSPVTGKSEFNSGIDIGSFPGAEVIATAPGTVYEIAYSENSGYYIKVAHKFGWKTIYSNLDRVKVKKGQQVSKSDVIGYVGKTPNNPVYHLHYEIHVGTQTFNPFSFLNQIQDK